MFARRFRGNARGRKFGQHDALGLGLFDVLDQRVVVARQWNAEFVAARDDLAAMCVGVPFLLGRPDLILPMLIGAALSMLLDGYMLYRMFDTRVFPASGTWPPGIAAAEAIRAGDAGGKRAALLWLGLLIGMAGSWFKIPM